jgi:Zn-dependent peptidase ImmA (M78 family)
MKDFVVSFIACTETEVRADCGGHNPITYTSREGKFNEVYVNTAKFDALPLADQFFIIAHEAQHAFANTEK